QDVRLDKDGIVFHLGFFEKENFTPGENVTLLIDKERRIKNAKSHSAGHLIDCAITKLNLAIKPTKGYHFSDGPYVEYEGKLENSQELAQKIQDTVNDLINQDITIIKTNLSSEQAGKMGIFVPVGKNARIIGFDGFASYGCGGTHVNATKEIGKIIIRKIKVKNGTSKICYEIV
ncbi:MAG: hypothetical protein ABH827_05515, partial [bacterium]